MIIAVLCRNLMRAAGALLLAATVGTAAYAQGGPIKIGLLVPLTGPLATPGIDMVDGFKLFWEQVNHQAAGRKVEYVIADTTCNPDQAITQARRLVHQEKVHLMIGPLCGHEGPAVAQVSKETGVPLVMDTAGADNVTKWDRTPTVVRTAVSASQIGHPFGDYLYKELGARNVTFIGQDYTWGHEVTLGAVETYKQAGGKVAKIIWNPIGTKDYGPTVASITPESDAVVAVVDDRAIGMIGNSLHYAAGLDTPENKAFVDAFAKKHKRLPSWFSESAYTASLWTRTAIEQIKGNVEDRTAFLAAMRGATVKAPRGTLKLDDYDNPIQNVYITRIQKIKHPVVGEVLTNVPFKTYENVSQFWTWKPEEFLKRGPYKR